MQVDHFAWTWLHYDHCRDQEGTAQPHDHMSRGFLRHVVPQLSGLVISNAARHASCDVCRASKVLRTLECEGCCPDHQLEDIASSGSVAAQLTSLDIWSQDSVKEAAGPLSLMNFRGLASPTARVAQVCLLCIQAMIRRGEA